jgi:hypothetical protein
MQLLGAADGPCAGRARRARDHRRRDLGRHRRRGDRGLPRPRQRTTSSSSSRTAASRRAARQMTTVDARANVHAHRARGHVRRLPGDREGAVQRPRLPRRVRCRASTRSTGRASWPDRLLLHGRVALGAPHRRSPSPCRPAISATSSPATSPSAWACRSSGWSSPPTTTTSWRARWRPALRDARRRADHLAVDGHPGLVELRAAAVRGLWPRRGAVRALMDGLAQSGAFEIDAGRSGRDPRRFRAGRADGEDETPPRSAACEGDETGYPARPAHRRRRRGRGEDAARGCPMVRWRPPIRPSSRTRSRRPAARRRRCRRASAGTDGPRRSATTLPTTDLRSKASSRTARAAGQESRSAPMTLSHPLPTA